MMMRRFAFLMLAVVLAATVSTSVSAAAETAEMTIVTAVTVPVPKGGDFGAVCLIDDAGTELVLPGDPGDWFVNAAFVGFSTPAADGWLSGIMIDETEKTVLMVDGGDRLNFEFDVDGTVYVFSFGPGSQLAVELKEGQRLLIPAQTVLLSPPQAESVPAAYAVKVE